MPELPEIESLRNYLIANYVIGSRITSVKFKWMNSIKIPDATSLISTVTGQKIHDIQRRGKYIIFCLASVASDNPRTAYQGIARSNIHISERSIVPTLLGNKHAEANRKTSYLVQRPSSHSKSTTSKTNPGYLILHMGMTGSLSLKNFGADYQPFVHTSIYLDDGRRIELNDPRKWASIWLVGDPSDVVGRLGPEPLDPLFTQFEFIERTRIRKSPIKSVLMNQSVLAGVGNIYADEALLRSGISPTRCANRISRKRLGRLFQSVRLVLIKATEFIAYNPENNDQPFVVNTNDKRMQINRKIGSRCPQCGYKLRVRRISRRTSYICDQCQT